MNDEEKFDQAASDAQWEGLPSEYKDRVTKYGQTLADEVEADMNGGPWFKQPDGTWANDYGVVRPGVYDEDGFFVLEDDCG